MDHRIPLFFSSRIHTRRIVAATFFLYLIGGIALLAGLVNLPHDFEWFLGILAFLSAGILFVPQTITQAIPRLKHHLTESDLGITECILTIAIMLSWIGSFKFYTAGFGYDSFVHFSSSLLAPLALATPLAVWYANPSPQRLWVILVIWALVLGSAVEFFEWAGDVVIGTTMSGEIGQPYDTWRDIGYDALGACIGAGIAVVTKKNNSPHTL